MLLGITVIIINNNIKETSILKPPFLIFSSNGFSIIHSASASYLYAFT